MGMVFGVPSKLLKMVRLYIEGSKYKIKFEYNYLEELETTVGLNQCFITDSL